MIILEDVNNKPEESVEKKPYTVYIHTFPNGKKYVGATRQKPIKRWCCGNGYKNQSKLFSAIQEFGWDSIKHEIVKDGLTESEAQELERNLIKEFKTQNPEFGYNTKNGGQVFGEHSEEFLEKMRDRMNGNTYCVGRKLSQKHIEALRHSRIGHSNPNPNKGKSIWSEEDKNRMSEQAKKRWANPELREKYKQTHAPMSGKNNPMFGKRHSEEAKEKIRQKALGRKVSEERRLQMSEKAKKRRVCSFSKDMTPVKSYDSIKEAANDVCLNGTNISFCCRNEGRTAAGLYWRYVDEDN